jgi:hypothetical protein
MKRIHPFLLILWIGFNTMLNSAQFVPANHPDIQYFGRWDSTDPLHPKHSWPGVSVYLEFTGTQIGVRLADGVNYYNVYIDGGFRRIFHGKEPGESDYTLADGLENTNHTLVFSKRNTSFDQIFSLSGFLLDEGAKLLAPPPKPVRKIEFLGDSFTAAEGNEATEQEMEWEAKMPVTNIDQGFAAVIARHFQAQVHTTCRPGIGMANDWTGDRDMVLSKRFDRALMDFEEPKWDFKQWIPDLAVICLGLNDYSGFGGWDHEVSESNSELYRTRYQEFIDAIRNVYPDVKILAVAAPVDWIRENVRRVVDDEKSKDHHDIYYAQFDEFPGGYVANGHPTVETHRKIADQIIEAIETNHLFVK